MDVFQNFSQRAPRTVTQHLLQMYDVPLVKIFASL